MRTIALCAILAGSVLATGLAAAGPIISIYTDAYFYNYGYTIEVSLSAQNDEAAMPVDVYVGILLPDGEIWSTQWDRWRHQIEPWVPNIYVPAWFEMPRAPYWTFDLPCDEPPIEDEGDYAFAALLTYPGTFDWVCNASLAPFSYQAVGPGPEITMLPIPAGSFLMGSPDDEEGRWDNEVPQRTV
ncbi:MAG: hypothetical protein JW941_10495, partial [Candidatus Coatesbacteria bacterium]|nr:hypothetical protein [Candidatus Coatesbacteria bacterium]